MASRVGPRARSASRALRALGLTIVACLAVVLLPSEAWAYTQPQKLGDGTYWSSVTVSGRGDGRVDILHTRPTANTGGRACIELSEGSVAMWDIGPATVYGAYTMQAPAAATVTGTGYGGKAGSRVVSSSNVVTHVRWWVKPSGVSTTWPTPSTSEACAQMTAPAGWVEVLYYGDSAGAVPPASACSAFSDTAAGYSASPPTLGLSFSWAGMGVPSNGWIVRDGIYASSTQVAKVGKVYRPGEKRYGFDSKALASALSSTTATLRVESASMSSCYALITLTGTLGPTLEPTGVPTDQDGGGCGWGDVACYLRAAFVPSQSTLTEFGNLRTRAATVIPLGYVTGAASALSSLATECSVSSGCSPDYLTGLCFSTGFLGSTGDGAGGDDVCPLTPTSPAIVWLQSHRDWLSVLAWLAVLGPLVGWVFRRFLPFGGGDG